MCRVFMCREQPVRVMGRAWNIKNDAGFLYASVVLAPNAIVGECGTSVTLTVCVCMCVSVCAPATAL